MKTLTVHQPYAHLIAIGIKHIENRSWPTAHRGPLAIHAAKVAHPLDADTRADLARLGIIIPVDLKHGAIIAIVNVVECIEIDDLPDSLAADPFAFGPWCWILADARLVAPISCRGKLGLWNAPELIEATAQ
jgi:activating signal cointegrator 1